MSAPYPTDVPVDSSASAQVNTINSDAHLPSSMMIPRSQSSTIVSASSSSNNNTNISMNDDSLSQSFSSSARVANWLPVPKGVFGIAIFPFRPPTQGVVSSSSSNNANSINNAVPTPPSLITSKSTATDLAAIANASGSVSGPSLPLQPTGSNPTSTSSVSTTTTSPLPAQIYQVPLGVGDYVQIIEECGEWLRGYVFSTSNPDVPPKLGIFPANYIYSTSISKYRHPSQPRRSRVPSTVNGLFVPDRTLKSALRKKSTALMSSSAAAISSSLGMFSANSTDMGYDNEYQVPTTVIEENKDELDGELTIMAYANRSMTQPPNAESTNDQLAETKPAPTPTPPPAPPAPSPQFPYSSVRIIPSPSIATHTTSFAASEPLIDEIASVLRELGSRLRYFLFQQNYALYDQVKKLFYALFQGRRQLLVGTLSQDELTKLRKELILKMESVNRLLGQDLIVRHPEIGFILGEENLSIPRLYRMHAVISERTEDESVLLTSVASAHTNNSGSTQRVLPWQTRRNPLIPYHHRQHQHASNKTKDSPVGLLAVQTVKPTLEDLRLKIWHLFFELRSMVLCVANNASSASPSNPTNFIPLPNPLHLSALCPPSEYLELYFAIYNEGEQRFVTEQYCIILDSNGVPTDETRIGKLRSMFTDMSHRELIEKMYIVCRVVRVGRMLMQDSTSLVGSGGKESSSTGSFFSTSNLFSGFSAAQAPISTMPQNAFTPNYEQYYRRPFGVAILDLEDTIRGASKSGNVYHERVMKVYVPSNEASFATFHESLIAKGTNSADINSKASEALGLAVSIKVFQGDLTSLAKEFSALLKDTVLTGRLGFSELIVPGEERSSIYLTLCDADFASSHKKLNVKNVEVAIQVRTSDGSLVDNCISKGAGMPLMTTYETVVYHHCQTPKYLETVRLDLPPEIISQCHVLFVYRTCSSKEKPGAVSSSTVTGANAMNERDKFWGFSVLPLLRGSNVILDGTHQLTIYRYEEKMMVHSIYLGLPPFTNMPAEPPSDVQIATFSADNFAKTNLLKDTLSVRTSLFSTKLTQNTAVLNLLNWKYVAQNSAPTATASSSGYNPAASSGPTLPDILREFTSVGELEIVKFLPDILDSIFGIMCSTFNAGGELDILTLMTLVFVLGVVIGKRFTSHRVIVDTYINETFHYPSAWRHLSRALNAMLSNPAGEYAKDLRNTIKFWQYVFRTMINSHLLEKLQATEDFQNRLEKEFKQQLFGLFGNINRMMGMTVPDSIVGSQALAFTHFPALVGELAAIYPPEEILDIVVALVDSSRNTKYKMVQHKLTFIHSLVKGPLFRERASRILLIKSVIRWAGECFSGEWERQAMADAMMQPPEVPEKDKPVSFVEANPTLQRGLSTRSRKPIPNAMMPQRGGVANATATRTPATVVKENIKLCLSVVAELLDRIYDLKFGGEEIMRGHVSGSMNNLNGIVADQQDLMETALLMADFIPILADMIVENIILAMASSTAPASTTAPSTSSPHPVSSPVTSPKQQYDSMPMTPSDTFSPKSAISVESFSNLFPTVSESSGIDNTWKSRSIMGSLSSMSNLGGTVKDGKENKENFGSGNIGVAGSSSNVNNQQSSRAGNGNPALFDASDFREFGTVLISIFGLLDGQDISGYIARYMFAFDKLPAADLMIKILLAFQSLLAGECALPSSWIGLNLAFSKNCMKVLIAITSIMEKYFFGKMMKKPKPGNTSATPIAHLEVPMFHDRLLAEFFRTLVILLNSPLLQFENFGEQSRRVVVRMRADIRAMGGDLLRSVWTSLSNAASVADVSQIFFIRRFQSSLIVALIGPCLEMTMSPNRTLRNAAVDTFFNILEAEYMSNGKLLRVEMICIEAMDQLVLTQGKGTEAAKMFLLNALRSKITNYRGDASFLNCAEKFLMDFSQFLELCYSIRGLPFGEEFDDDRMSCVFKLMKFIKALDCTTVFIKYVSFLTELQLRQSNPIEAGLMLKMYADMLDWSDKVLPALPEYGFVTCDKSFLRKESLYMVMMELFEEGQAWEKALELAKELAVQYHDPKTFDYSKLAALLTRQAALLDKIVNRDRFPSSYFRVGFYGKGWPIMVRGKQYVYRGAEYEKIATFCERMLNKYAGSSLIKGNSPVTDDIINGDGLYMQIVSVKPVPSTTNIYDLINRSPGAQPKKGIDFVGYDVLKMASKTEDDSLPVYVKSYYETNDVNVFVFDRPYKRPMASKSAAKPGPANEFLELWTEKTFLVTEHPLPYLLRRSEVVSVKSFELSPIENAVMTVINKNKELLQLTKRFAPVTKGQDVNCNPLTMSLNGAIDAPVNGGITMYRLAFLNEEFQHEFPDKIPLVEKLMEEIVEQVNIY